MTKKDMLLEPAGLAARKPAGVAGRLSTCAALRGLARLYGNLLEREITPRQALHLLHVQAAGAALALPFAVHAGLLTASQAGGALPLHGRKRPAGFFPVPLPERSLRHGFFP